MHEQFTESRHLEAIEQLAGNLDEEAAIVEIAQMEHLAQDDRKSMVEYGRDAEGGRRMLDVLMAELIWNAILTKVEGEKP